MKKIFSFLLVLLSIFCVFGCGSDNYVLTENNFFLIMTNMQYYPESYFGKDIECDCFTYDLTDVNGTTYRLGVRKCSAGYGCQCGKDTVIGFILDYSGEIPNPVNQSVDTVEKTWIHIKGQLKSSEKTKIEIFAYDADGNIDTTKNESIEILTFKVDTMSTLTSAEYADLNYYVVK